MRITVVGMGSVRGGLADLWEQAGHCVKRLGRGPGGASDAVVVLLAGAGRSDHRCFDALATSSASAGPISDGVAVDGTSSPNPPASHRSASGTARQCKPPCRLTLCRPALCESNRGLRSRPGTRDRARRYQSLSLLAGDIAKVRTATVDHEVPGLGPPCGQEITTQAGRRARDAAYNHRFS